MKAFLALATLVSLIASTQAFADGGEICKGADRNGDGITLIWSGDEMGATINAQGEQNFYNLDPIGGGDVSYAFDSQDNGGLKVTFYDQDNSASGWSANLGAFKLSCKDLKK